jgi:GT2 family glycosyltransferase
MTRDGPRASIIICVYNRPDQVVECLESLLALDYQDFEIVAVDDGSTDETPGRLRQFQKDHPEKAVTIVRRERNAGLSAARNAGIQAARGEYVFFTDSDCRVDRSWLGAMLQAFDAPDVAAVMGLVRDQTPRNLSERAYVVSPRIEPDRWRQRVLAGNNMGFRRAVAAAYLFDEAMSYYCDEIDLAHRLLADGHRIAFAPQAVVHHNHPMTLGKYLKLGYRQAQGSARFWYKYGIVGRDLLPLAAALLTLPLGLADLRLLAVPGFFLLLQVAAIAHTEMAAKGKGVLETLRVLPLCCLYFACRAWGVLTTFARIAGGGESAIGRSKRHWRERQRAQKRPSAAGHEQG